MSQFHALMWKVRPGTEEKVEALLRDYPRPDPVVRDSEGKEKARLLGTQVFMKDNVVVRVIEVEGDLREVSAHMGRQPGTRELEGKLDEYVETPRDMSSPEGARAFFASSRMNCVFARRRDD